MSPHKAPYVFVGGVDVSAACLGALCGMGLPPALAVGYGNQLAQSSGYVNLGDIAWEHGASYVAADDVNDEHVVRRMREVRPRVIYVIGWSQLVKKDILCLPRHGCVGIHPTRLPEGRGRAPIPWTILKGLRVTASTMFFLTEGVDDGDIIDQIEIVVEPRETATTLYAKHRRAHVELIRRHGEALLEGTVARMPQDGSKATYWERRRPEDGRIDWRQPAAEVDRLVRAVTRPFPGAFFETAQGRVTVWEAEPRPPFGASPGSIRIVDGTPYVACGDGSLALLEWGGSLIADE